MGDYGDDLRLNELYDELRALAEAVDHYVDALDAGEDRRADLDAAVEKAWIVLKPDA